MNIENEIRELTEKLKTYQDAYYKNGVSLVPDIEYDRLFDKLKSLEEKYPEYILPDSPTLRVGSDLTNEFPEFEHTIPVLSLDKAYSKEEVLSFFDKSIKKIGENLSFAAEEKIDGISMVLYYEDGLLVRAVTRGNGSVGNEVTPNIITIKSVPIKLNGNETLAVRGEVFLSKENFKKINEKITKEEERAANPRNLASGTVRRIKSSEAAAVPLDIFVYEGFWLDKDKEPKDHLSILSKLKSLGFKINPNFAFFDKTKEEAEIKLKSANLSGHPYAFSDLEEFIKKKTEERPKLKYEIDGLVFKINELEVREELGYTEHHPRWAIAYKFESPQATAVLLDITCQVGRTGRITPVAEITPTPLGGSTIKRATLHNQEYIDQLELAIGDTVTITKRGDVIPAVEEVIEKNEEGNKTFIIPDICPSCASKLEKTGAHLFCPNLNCPERVKGTLSFFASRDQMGIDGLGPKTVETLYNMNLLHSISDIYTLDYNKLNGVEGFGEKTIDSLKKSVERSKNESFITLLSSLGIPDLGRKSATILAEGGFDSFKKLIEAAKNKNLDSFTSIKMIGSESAKAIIDAFSKPYLIDQIDKLASLGLNIDQSLETEDLKKEQIFEGQIWVATGSFENFNPRGKALKEIEIRGGKTSNAISSKTTHLLVGKGGGSKRKEAEKLGVTLINEEEFLRLLGDKKEKSEDKDIVQGELFEASLN